MAISVKPFKFTVELGIGCNHSCIGWYYTGNVSVDSLALVLLMILNQIMELILNNTKEFIFIPKMTTFLYKLLC